MSIIVCLLFFLVLIFVIRYVGSGYTNVVFRLSLYLLGLKLSLYLVRILYFVVLSLITRVIHVVTYKTSICLVYDADYFNDFMCDVRKFKT